MDAELHRCLLERDEKGLDDLYYDGESSHFFVVDWREDDGDIVDYCSTSLGIDNLTAEWREDVLFTTFGTKTVRISPEDSEIDRHMTVCALNDLLSPYYEIRYFIGSHGDDSGGFAALPVADWQSLETECPLAIKENFIDPRALPNVFTELIDDTIPEPARSRHKRMIERNRRK